MRKYPILFLVLLLSASSWATLTVDATSNLAAAQASGTTMTWSHTCTGSNRVLVVMVGMIATTLIPTTVTYNSVAMKQVSAVRDHGGSEMFNYIYVLVAPATGAHNVVVTVSGTMGAEFGSGAAISFTGAHQSYPNRLTWPVHSGGTSGTTITTSAADAVSGDYVVGAAIGHTGTITPDGTQTAITTWNAWNSGQNTSWATAYIAAATRTTLIWTQTSAVFSGTSVVIRPDTDTPTVPVYDSFVSTVGTAIGSPFTSTISSFTVASGTNSLLLYFAGEDDAADTISSVTFNGVNLTKLDACKHASGNGAEIWYLKNPTPATANIVATFTGTMDNYMAAAEVWYLVNQSSTFGTVAKATTTGVVTVTVSSNTTAIVHDVASVWNAGTVMFPSGAELMSLNNGTDGNDITLSQRKMGGASVVMGWSGTNSNGWCEMGFGINFSSGAGVVRHRSQVINR